MKAPDPAADLRRAIEQRFGSLEKWAADFIASAKAAAGWAMLVVHPVNGRLYNVVSDEHAQGPLWLAMPLVVALEEEKDPEVVRELVLPRIVACAVAMRSCHSGQASAG